MVSGSMSKLKTKQNKNCHFCALHWKVRSLLVKPTIFLEEYQKILSVIVVHGYSPTEVGGGKSIDEDAMHF